MDFQNPDFPLSGTCLWICTWRWHSTESFPHKLQTQVLAKLQEEGVTMKGRKLNHSVPLRRVIGFFNFTSGLEVFSISVMGIWFWHCKVIPHAICTITARVVLLKEQLVSLCNWYSIAESIVILHNSQIIAWLNCRKHTWQKVACWELYGFVLSTFTCAAFRSLIFQMMNVQALRASYKYYLISI